MVAADAMTGTTYLLLLVLFFLQVTDEQSSGFPSTLEIIKLKRTKMLVILMTNIFMVNKEILACSFWLYGVEGEHEGKKVKKQTLVIVNQHLIFQ